ncbi:hypothetical protein EYF80_030259 [Liparis tanakae]|uniref:Uncharacterized protein n=1 Tax=Liparis tanakae TaxID=230148 RepID=A0A4Z2H2K4_9TELE|nr:hypothetical protein EYF80_030259 [Liparis tanakae]
MCSSKKKLSVRKQHQQGGLTVFQEVGEAGQVVRLIKVAVLLFLFVLLLFLFRPLTGIPIFLTFPLFLRLHLVLSIFTTSLSVCPAEVGDEEHSEAVTQLNICSLILLSLRYTVFTLKSMPTVLTKELLKESSA